MYVAQLLNPAASKVEHLTEWSRYQLFTGIAFRADDLRDAAAFFQDYMRRVYGVGLSLASGEFACRLLDEQG